VTSWGKCINVDGEYDDKYDTSVEKVT